MALFSDDDQMNASAQFYRTSTAFKSAFTSAGPTPNANNRLRQHSYPAPSSVSADSFAFDPSQTPTSSVVKVISPTSATAPHHVTSMSMSHKYPSKLDYEYDPDHKFDRFGSNGKPFNVPTNAAQEFDRRPSHPMDPYHSSSTSFMAVHSQTPFGPHINGASLTTPSERQSTLDRTMSLERAGSIPSEEICTIFVVGFPDDMQEREFQNMFTFAPGFEAATLKIPHRDNLTLNLAGPLSNGTSTMHQHNSFDSWDMNPAAQNASAQPQNPRKQIIGFAKFRTRLEALSARDALQGRRVDLPTGASTSAANVSTSISGPLGSLNGILGTGRDAANALERGGCVLKAEMAKKNLHTKRGGTAPTGPAPALGSAPSSSLATIPDEWDHVNNNMANLVIGSSARGPREREREREEEERERERRRERAAFDAFHSVPAQQTNPPLSNINDHPINGRGDGSSASSSSEAEKDAVLPEENSSPEGSANDHNYDRRDRERDRGLVDQNPPINTLYVGNLPSSPTSASAFPSAFASGTSFSASSNTMAASSANSGLEEALRDLFGRCPGFRKLVFRMKGAGPMCFVEFEDTSFATKALSELGGNTLGGRVKGGGIRLSYSKNPLGVRTPTGADEGPPFGTNISGSGGTNATTLTFSNSNTFPNGVFGGGTRSGYTSPTNSYGFVLQSPGLSGMPREQSQSHQAAPRFFSSTSPPLSATSASSVFAPPGSSAFSPTSMTTSFANASSSSTFAPFGAARGPNEPFGRALSPA